MKVAIFCHSLVSDWNHGNAHFLRGVSTELQARGHEVHVYEPADAWSVENLVRDHGTAPLEEFARAYPTLKSTRYDLTRLDLDQVLHDIDLVLVHEWNSPELVRRLGEHRARRTGYRLLFHDTHHRMVSRPEEMERYDLRHYDGVLAFGRVIADLYRSRGLAQNVWTWHEAADVRVFRPLEGQSGVPLDLAWIGNWGDDERSAELQEFLIGPTAELGLNAEVRGVRYPDHALTTLKASGIQFGGWIANFDAPSLLSRARMTVHVPRSPYVKALPGIPTIRVFESLACGVPLITAPWEDSEDLFTPERDFLIARDGREMRKQMARVLEDVDLARSLARSGRDTILARHTCAHRVSELLAIHEFLSEAPQ